MADILIRGMKMPKYTTKAEFGIDADGNPLCMVCHEDGTEPDIYDVVPLPEGHGDLIDRDALKKRTPMVIDYSAGGFGTDGSIRSVRGYGDWQIDQAPTIVPAEGGKE